MDEVWCVREGWLLKRATVTHRFIRRYVALHSDGHLTYAEAPENVELWALRGHKQAKVIDLRHAIIQNEIYFNAGRFIFQLTVPDYNNKVTTIQFAHTLGEVVAGWLADIVYLSQRIAGVTPCEPVTYEDFTIGEGSPYASYAAALQKVRGPRNAVPSIQRRALIEGIRHYVAVRTSFEAAFTRYCSEVVLPMEYDRTADGMTQQLNPCFRLTVHHSIQEHHICKQMAHEHQCSDLLETRLFWEEVRLAEADDNVVCPRALLDIGPVRVGCVALPATPTRYEDENSEFRETITKRLTISMWDSEAGESDDLIIDSTNDANGYSAVVDCASFLPQVYATSFVRAEGAPDAAQQYTFMCVQILDHDTHIEDSIPMHTHTTQVNSDLQALLAARLEFDSEDITHHLLPSQQLQVFIFGGNDPARVYNPLISVLLGRPSYGSAIVTTMISPDNFSHPVRPEFAEVKNASPQKSQPQSPRGNGGASTSSPASTDWKEWNIAQARALATDVRYAHGEVDDARAFGAPKVAAERKRVWISNPRQFASLLHERGVSVRYLPILKSRLQSTNPALHGMICAEIIGRVAKQVLKWRVSNVSRFAADTATAVHHMLQAALELLNDIIAGDDSNDGSTNGQRKPSVFWHLESRLCLLLGPYSIFGGFEFTASERRSVRHICASIPVQAILPSVCGHCNINLRPSKIRALISEGVHCDTKLSLEDLMPHGYQPALDVPLTKLKGRDSLKKKLMKKIQGLVDANARNRRVSLPAGSVKDRRQMLEREHVTDAVEEVLRLTIDPQKPSPVLLYVSIFESVLAKQAATLADGSDWNVQEFERVIRMLSSANEHGAPPPLFPAGLAVVAAVARVCNMLTQPEARTDMQLRDQIIQRFVAIWQFMYVYWPLSFDGIRSYLWTASPVIPLLFMHIRNCIAPAIAQRVIRLTTLPFSSLQTSGIILADLLEAMQHTLSNEPGTLVPFEVMMHLLEPTGITVSAADAEPQDIAADSGRVLLQGNLTGLSLEAQAKRRASIRTQGQASSQRTPFLPLPLPDHMAVWKVSCGQRHTALLTTQGLLYTFGHGEGGRLGHGNQNTMTVPCVVQYFLDRSIPITDVACGALHTLAVTAAGEAYSWGWGEGGRLGIGQTVQELAPKSVHKLRSKGIKVVSVACGGEHSLFISSDGQLFSCGVNSHGQLGHGGTRDCNNPQPVRDELANVKVAGAAGGLAHTVICTTDGDVFSWGFGESGALGHGDFESCDLPRRMQSFANYYVDGERIRIVQVACGQYFTLARDAWGGVWSWGDGALGQLGTLDMDRIAAQDDRLHTPHKVQLPFLGEDNSTDGQMKGSTRVVRMQSLGIRQLQSIESLADDIARAKEELKLQEAEDESLSRPKACYVGAGDTAGICLTTSGTLLLWGSITGRNPEEHELRPHPVPVVSFTGDCGEAAGPGSAKPVHTVLVRAADVGGYQLVAATPVMGDGTKMFASEEIRKLIEKRLLGDIDEDMWKPMIQQDAEQRARSGGPGGSTRGRRAASPTFGDTVRSLFFGGSSSDTQQQQPPSLPNRSRSVVELSVSSNVLATAKERAPAAAAAPAAGPPAGPRGRIPPQRRKSLPGQMTRGSAASRDVLWSPAIRSRELRKMRTPQPEVAAGANGHAAEDPGPQTQARVRRDLSPPPRRGSTWARNSLTPSGSREGSFSEDRPTDLMKVPSNLSVHSLASTSSSISAMSTHSDPLWITHMRGAPRRTTTNRSGSPRAYHDRSSSHEQSDSVPEALLEAVRKPPGSNDSDDGRRRHK